MAHIRIRIHDIWLQTIVDGLIIFVFGLELMNLVSTQLIRTVYTIKLVITNTTIRLNDR